MEQKKGIDSLMSENRTFPPADAVRKKAYVGSFQQYKEMWDASINQPDKFWLEQANTLHWFKKPSEALKYTWDTKNR
ncbi:MAG: acsA, partial [Acidobacteria bacterium]|nr:acsA [Acidobacteriota bacterium]